MDDAFTLEPPWSGGDPIWAATSFILHRNIAPFHFPSHMSETEAEQTLNLITGCFAKRGAKIFQGNDLSPIDKEFLFEHFILHEGFEKFDPGRALVLDDSTHFLSLINIEDHLHMHLFAMHDSYEASYQKLAEIEHELAKSLSFAYSERFGYLTSDPRICGTGLIVQVFLHLPAMIHLKQFSEFVEKLGDEITVSGLGQEREYIADLVLVENRYKLGVTEDNILQMVKSAAQKLREEEMRLRSHLKEMETELLKDKVSRAFGLLGYAQTLHIQETLTHLSLFHLGKELGWIQNAEGVDFYNLFFTTRRGHLQKLFSLGKEALSQKRAEIFRDKIKDCKLVI